MHLKLGIENELQNGIRGDVKTDWETERRRGDAVTEKQMGRQTHPHTLHCAASARNRWGSSLFLVALSCWSRDISLICTSNIAVLAPVFRQRCLARDIYGHAFHQGSVVEGVFRPIEPQMAEKICKSRASRTARD